MSESRNPYEAPRASAVGAGSGDATDLFLEARPNGLVNLAALLLLAEALFQVLLAFRLMVAFGDYNTSLVPVSFFGMVARMRPVWIEAAHVVVGGLTLVGFFGLRRARSLLVIVGAGGCVASIATCALAIVTGSIGALAGLGLAIAGLVLVLVTAERVRRMQDARIALATALSSPSS